MQRILFILSLLLIFDLFKFNKAEKSVVLTDLNVTASLDYYAPDYKVFILDNGAANQIFVKFTTIKVPSETTMAYFAILEETMGEYKVRPGLEYSATLCDVINEPIVLGRLMKCMGFTGCPIGIGDYGNEAIEIDPTVIPDEFPPNKYLLQSRLETEDHMLGTLTLFFTIQ